MELIFLANMPGFKDKKGATIINVFQRILNSSTRKPNKIWVDKGSEFYNSSSKKWFNNRMYSTQNEGNSVLAERFIKTLKNKMYKHMTDVSKNVYIDKLDDTVNEYNNTYHRTIQMKPIDVKDNIYIDSVEEVNAKDFKFNVRDHIRKTKYKNIFTEGYTPNWSEAVTFLSYIFIVP